MKICLINPPVPKDESWVREGRCQQLDIWGAAFPPLTLALTSRQLSKAGHQTIIIDAGPEGKNLSAVISQCREFQPDVLVMTAATPTIETDMSWFVPAMKKEFPKLKVIALGIHVSTLPVVTLQKYPHLDIVVLREPEQTVEELCSKEIKLEHLQGVKGIAYRNSDAKVVVNPERPLLDDLDSLGFPEWEKVNLNRYIMPIKGRPFSMLHFARGCPHKCDYCTAHVFNGRKFRKRSIASLISEIEFNVHRGVVDFLFWSEMSTADNRYLTELLDAIIEKGLNKKIFWVCNSRIDTVSPELLRKMKQAGCWQIAFGFDFGSDRIYELSKKGGRATVELGRKVAQWAHAEGIIVDGHFMLGYPGEKMDDLKATLDFAMQMPLTFSHFYPAVPYPGADFFSTWVDNNRVDLSEVEWRKFDQSAAVIGNSELKAEEVFQFKHLAYAKFYSRPSVLFRIFKIPKSFREFFNLCDSGMQIVKKLVFG